MQMEEILKMWQGVEKEMQEKCESLPQKKSPNQLGAQEMEKFVQESY